MQGQGSSLSTLWISQVGFRSFLNRSTTRLINVRQLMTTKNQSSSFKFCDKSYKTPSLRVLTKNNVFSKTILRRYSVKPKEFVGKNALERFRLRDGVPKSYTLIYRSDFPNYLLFSQIFVFLATGAIVISTILHFINKELTEEEKRRWVIEKKEEYRELKRKEKESRLGQFVEAGKRELGGVEGSPSSATLDDVFEAEPEQMFVILASFVVLALAMVRLQRIMPVRIYTSDKKHCIAIMYGHVLPGKLTWHEFLAGTLRPGERKRFEFYSHATYKDGSGKPLLILDQYFRSPADYNKLMGFDQEEDDEALVNRYTSGSPRKPKK